MLNLYLLADDLFYGQIIVMEAFKISAETAYTLNEGWMNLRKLETNSEELRKRWIGENIPVSNPDTPNTSTKVSGVSWYNKDDNLGLELRPSLSKLNYDWFKKRNILKLTAMIFDLAGFIAPFVLRIKCLLQ